jgi:hypothetical protein
VSVLRASCRASSPAPGHPVTLADRLTAATSPLAAFAGLSVGLLVVKMTRQPARAHPKAALMLAPPPPAAVVLPVRPFSPGTRAAPGLLRDATIILRNASARGQRLSQRTLARELRGHGHHFGNDHLRHIAQTIGLTRDAA